MLSEPVHIYLTKGQKKKVQPVFDEVEKAYDNGRPGSVFCQVYKTYIAVNFVEHERAKRISAILEEV